MRPSEKHLDESELDALLTSESMSVKPVNLEEVFDHAKQCHSCDWLVQTHSAVKSEMSQLRALGYSDRRGDCTHDVNWVEVAAGLWPEAKAQRLLEHAARCSVCGELLKEATAFLSNHVTVEEEQNLHLLRSAADEWTSDIGVQLSQHATAPREGRSRPVRNLWLLPSFAVMGVCLAAVWLVWFVRQRGVQQDSTVAVQQLLAQAYSDQRTLVLRFPGAAHSPLRISRGNDISSLDRPPTLLEAEARIGQKQTQGVRNAGWLVVRGQADILEWNYDPAITTLTEAQALSTNANELTTIRLNLSSAYFERAEAAQRPGDYAKAADLLGQILQSAPNDPVALFNQAIIYERLSLLCNAASDWKRYMQIDPDGDWSTEAYKQLSDVKVQIEKKGNDCAEPPEPVADNSRELPFSEDVLDSRIEEYQRLFLVQWWPEYLRATSTGEREHILGALDLTARVSESRHHDRFYSDLMRGSKILMSNSIATEPVKALARAIESNQSGKENEALLFSQAAEKGFRSSGNMAGALRAKFEEVYARQFSFDPGRCQSGAAELANRSHQLGYRWLEAQALTEQGFCANMAGDLAAARAELEEAGEVAKNASYEETRERTLVGEAAVEWQAGSPSMAWTLVTDGLWRYWHSSSSVIRGISFLDILDLIAEDTQLWHFQEAALKESLSLVERQKDPLILGQTRYRIAFSELMMQQNMAAEENLLKAAQAFAAAPESDSSHRQQTVVSISLAKAEMQRGEFRLSLDRLNSLQTTINSLNDNLSLLDYYSTLGEVYRNIGESEAAERAYETAVSIFTKSLDSISAARDRLTWYRQASIAYRALVQLRIDENDPPGALDLWESYRRSAFFAEDSSSTQRSDGKRRRTDAHVKSSSLLKDKEIIYVRLPSGLYGWLRDGVTIHGVWLTDDESQYERERALFVADCADPFSSTLEIVKSGQHLYSRFVLPFEQWLLVGDSVAIQPDDEQTQVPFPALVDGAGAYISAKYSIVISPARGEQARRPVERFTKEDAALFVTASDASAGKKIHDPTAEIEVRQIASLFSHPEIVIPGDLSIRQFESLLSHASVFHYAGHSLTTSARGGQLLLQLRDPSGLYVASLFRSQDLARTWLPRCKLVVLSACSTDRGEEGHWLDRENLALAFLVAGVPQVVATLWDVDSEATASLMIEFYKELLGGAPVAKALNTAEGRVRNNAGTSHPYYWAAFSVLESA